MSPIRIEGLGIVLNVGNLGLYDMEELNPKQELFCKYYATNIAETIGNGTKAYLLAYPDSSEDAARSSASDLLTNPNIIARLKEYWSQAKLTDEEVDAHLASIVRQNKDLKTKLGSIREYNRLGERGAEVHKVDVYEKYKDK